MLKIFEVDHFIVMWRVYNNVADFERLKITQLNNQDSCKLGKWMHAQTDPKITGSQEFKKLDSAHRLVHKYACDSWMAKDKEMLLQLLRHLKSAVKLMENSRRLSVR